MTPTKWDGDTVDGGSNFGSCLRDGGARRAVRSRVTDDLIRNAFASVSPPDGPSGAGRGIDDFVERLIAGSWTSDGDTSLAMVVAAARRLGDRWNEDSCTFWDVTIGMARLSQELMAIDRAAPIRRGPTLGRVLLAAAPGDQHGFGVATVATALRGAGWDVTADIASDPDALIDAVRRQPFAIVGLSVGHERALAPTANLIAELRSRSRNKGVRIALGGAILNGRAALAKALGADIHADDAAGFVAAAEAHALEPA